MKNVCVYPYYGVAPHHCYYKHGGVVGVYEYCMICGSKS